MAVRKQSESQEPVTPRKPATTPEARENQLISLAYDVAEQQMRAGTASAQVITSFLKLGSTRERLEQERLRHETALMEAKQQQLADAVDIKALYEDAIVAMRTYSGHAPVVSDDDYED